MISIIMPLFNAEKYLCEAIEAVIRQTYTEFELICIDDASDDSTSQIVRNYQKDRRIKLVCNEKRMGAAYSRNRGINIAKGDYVSFLDGDDVFCPQMLECAYNCAVANRLDLVIFEFVHAHSNNIGKEGTVYRSDVFYTRHSQIPITVKDVSMGDFSKWNGGPCNKLIKRDFIINNNLKFQDISSQNDLYFVNMSYLLAERLMFLADNRVMLYARDHDSRDRITNNKSVINGYLAYEKILDSLIEKKQSTLFAYAHYKFYLLLVYLLKGKDGRELYNYLKSECTVKLYYYDEMINQNKKSYVPLLSYLLQDDLFEWIYDENALSVALRNSDNEIYRILDNCDNCTIWGAGKYGKTLLKSINPVHRSKVRVIDNNANDLKIIEGFVVEKPTNAILKGSDIIILALSKVTGDIYAEIAERKASVFFALDYI